MPLLHLLAMCVHHWQAPSDSDDVSRQSWLSMPLTDRSSLLAMLISDPGPLNRGTTQAVTPESTGAKADHSYGNRSAISALAALRPNIIQSQSTGMAFIRTAIAAASGRAEDPSGSDSALHRTSVAPSQADDKLHGAGSAPVTEVPAGLMCSHAVQDFGTLVSLQVRA